MTPEEIEKLPYRPCAGVMLVNGDGKVFVGQRIDSEYDAWQMPQGASTRARSRAMRRCASCGKRPG